MHFSNYVIIIYHKVRGVNIFFLAKLEKRWYNKRNTIEKRWSIIETIGERLKYLRKDVLDLGQIEFGKKLNLNSNSIVSQLETGTRNVTDRTILDICREFNVNEHWLRTGEGDILTETDTISLDEYAKQKKASPAEVELFKAYLNLSDELRDELINFITDFGHKKVENPDIKVLDFCIEEENKKEVFSAASSTNHEPPKRTKLSDEDYNSLGKKLANAPRVKTMDDL